MESGQEREGNGSVQLRTHTTGERKCSPETIGGPARAYLRISPRTAGAFLSLRVHPLHCETRHFPRIREVQLFLDVGSVSFHRLGAQVQLLRDAAHFAALADELEHFQFTIG